MEMSGDEACYFLQNKPEHAGYDEDDWNMRKRYSDTLWRCGAWRIDGVILQVCIVERRRNIIPYCY